MTKEQMIYMRQKAGKVNILRSLHDQGRSPCCHVIFLLFYCWVLPKVCPSPASNNKSNLDLPNMAAVGRVGRLLWGCKGFVVPGAITSHARCMSVVAGSTQHTLSVKKRIDKTREASLLGGGQKRIDKQHQKVVLSPLNFSVEVSVACAITQSF